MADLRARALANSSVFTRRRADSASRVCIVRARRLAYSCASILRAQISAAETERRERERERERQEGRKRERQRARPARNVRADASVSPPCVTGEYSFIKLGARRVRARSLRRHRSAVASCDRSVVGSQVFFVSLSRVPSSSVVDLARSSRLVLARAYVSSFLSFFFLPLSPSLLCVNSTWISSLADDPRRSHFTFR